MPDPTVDTVPVGHDPGVDSPVAGQGWKPPSLILQVIALVVVLTYAAIVWTLPRGFDLTDESFVYAMIASNRVAVGEPWGFQHLLHPLYVATGESVLAFRVLRLAGYVLLSVALVRIARAVLSNAGIRFPRSAWTFIFLLAQVGTFLAWSYPPRTLGYNEPTAWLVQLGVALIVFSLSAGMSSPPRPRARSLVVRSRMLRSRMLGSRMPGSRMLGSRMLGSLWAGLGAITTLIVFSKISAGVAFGFFLVLALLVPNPRLRLPLRFAATGAGAMTVVLMLLLFRYPMVAYLQSVSALLLDQSAQAANNHSFPVLLQVYAKSMSFTGRALVPALLAFALTMSTFHRAALAIDDGRRRALGWISWVLGALLATALLTLPGMTSSLPLTRSQGFSYLGTVVVFIGAAAGIGLVMVRADLTAPRGSTSRRPASLGPASRGSALRRWAGGGSFAVAVGVLAVIATPFISAVGTNVRLAGELIYAATLWAVVLGIALVLLARRATELRSSARSMPLLIGAVVVLMAAQAVQHDIARPYRIAPLLLQKTPTSVPELRGVLLTRAQARWLSWVAAAGRSLGAAGVPATAMSSPGALYVFNHSGYAQPWLDSESRVALTSLGHACNSHPPSDLFVLQPGTQTADGPTTIAMRESLAGCGVRFPGDFTVVRKRLNTNPRYAMTIWRLKGRGPTSSALVSGAKPPPSAAAWRVDRPGRASLLSRDPSPGGR